MGVSVDLTARTGPAQKELEQFGKKLTGLAKLWEGAFGGKGQRQAGQNLQQLSKGLQALTKQAEAAQQRLQRINQTLEQVTSKRKALEGTMGAVSLRDKDSYKLVADQERMLTRQKSTWQAIAATRASMVANAAAAPGGPPPPAQAPPVEAGPAARRE
jgi:ABC-type transporter Mla subunit MlaD